ncbi:glycosyltransferase family 2 protein [Cellulosimicrobium cellulans]|uniref:glycosyltransferase family 2 protein n=1 Tax=Cellulosimicrobium cellulans TaxID=1710 RepID=UPI000848F95D|nr:glycosyltransferase family 2 protein [Cellulosimicrobium cellulans]
MTSRRTGTTRRSAGVTLVVPVLDDAAHLDRLLRSVAAQTRAPDAVVVVDNGSRDDGVAVARAHGATVLHEPRRGIWPAAARGYDAARTEVVARCDADTVLPPTWVEHVAARFGAEPDLAALTGPADFAGVHRALGHLGGSLYLGAYFLLVGALVRGTALFGSNLAMRADVWRAVRDEVHDDVPSIHDDMDLSYHVRGRGRVERDAALRVTVSGRPLVSLRGIAARGAWGARTSMLHAPGLGPRVGRRWAGRDGAVPTVRGLPGNHRW